jgi:hypothetical protein
MRLFYTVQNEEIKDGGSKNTVLHGVVAFMEHRSARSAYNADSGQLRCYD